MFQKQKTNKQTGKPAPTREGAKEEHGFFFQGPGERVSSQDYTSYLKEHFKASNTLAYLSKDKHGFLADGHNEMVKENRRRKAKTLQTESLAPSEASPSAILEASEEKVDVVAAHEQQITERKQRAFIFAPDRSGRGRRLSG